MKGELFEKFRQDRERLLAFRRSIDTSQLERAADALRARQAMFQPSSAIARAMEDAIQARKLAFSSKAIAAQMESQFRLQDSFREALEHHDRFASLRQSIELAASPIFQFVERIRLLHGALSESVAEAASRLLDGLSEPPAPRTALTLDEAQELGEEDQQDGRTDSDLWIPPDIAERLARVKFIPVTMALDIARTPDLMRTVDPRKFEELIAALVEEHGFKEVNLTPPANDGGRDVIAVARMGGTDG